MPHREDASFYRPRLYDRDDPKMPDEVTLVLGALEDHLEDAIDEGDDDRVKALGRLIDRIEDGAGEAYQVRRREEAMEA